MRTTGVAFLISAESAIHRHDDAGRWPASESNYTRTQGVALGCYESGLRPAVEQIKGSERLVRNASWWNAFAVLVVLFTVGQQATAATNDPALALQKGLFEEEANHDLNAAIRAYQAVIKQFDQDRKLAATAVFRLGECYRKQGNTNDANAQYERVIREFPDQTPLVTLSRSYLGVTESGTAAGPTVGEIRQDLAKAAVPASEETDEVRRIQAMIKDSPDLINARNEIGQTPLHRAAEKGQVTVATFLLENGAEVDPADKLGQTPLHRATSQGQKAMMELLMAHKADVQAKRNDATAPTPLHIAVEHGLRTLVELLLAQKAEVNAKGGSGTTPLCLAAAKGFKVIAELLIQKGADVNAPTSDISNPNGGSFNGAPLHIAAQRGDLAMTELLLSNKADPNAKLEEGQTPLHNAASWGHEAVAKALLEHGAEVNARTKNGYTPLALAVGRQNPGVAKVLLAARADPNISFDQGGNQGQRTPLHLGVERGSPELVRLLLQNGADPNVQNLQNQETALIEAVRLGRGEIVSLLLDAKADPNIADSGRWTALHNAVAQPAVVEALLAAKPEVNPKNREGETPLHWAAGCGLKPAAELLLAHGADTDARDNLGNTPLHFAVLAGRADLVDYLLVKGADPNVANQDGKTPLNLAKAGLGNPGATSWIQIPNNAAFLRQYPSQAGGRLPPMPGIPLGLVANSGQSREEISATLKSHGALEDLPHLDRIEVKRPSTGYSATVLYKGTNDWNHFSLLEALAMRYEFLTEDPSREGTPRETRQVWANRQRLIFPDLGAVRIRRPEADLKTWHDRKIDLSALLTSGDCSKDVPLNWGEVIEVPEADHPLNDRWQGFSRSELINLKKCLSRKVQVIIKGRATQLNLGPDFLFFEDANGVELPPESDNITMNSSMWIKPALRQSNLLLASSDQSRIKVTRLDPATGQKREWVLDCSDHKSAPAFWLRDGDVIEVPEKP